MQRKSEKRTPSDDHAPSEKLPDMGRTAFSVWCKLMGIRVFSGLLLVFCLCASTGVARPQQENKDRRPEVVVLGIAQDGGVPQPGTSEHQGWTNDSMSRNVACLGLLDPESGARWLIEATPDFPEQLQHLDRLLPTESAPGLQGIFLTHAHIGHYTGLMYLGHEVMGARGVPVFVLPRMYEFLSQSGPWDQLVRLENIVLNRMTADKTITLNERVRVTPFLVPHRQEYTEVAGFRIEGPEKSVLFIPDIDSWEEWDSLGTRIDDLLAGVDRAYLDATFFANGEIPNRDMSGFPHPFITHSMERFSNLPAAEKRKVRFIHLNHTNPALWPDSDARLRILQNGFNVAEEGERFKL